VNIDLSEAERSLLLTALRHERLRRAGLPVEDYDRLIAKLDGQRLEVPLQLLRPSGRLPVHRKRGAGPAREQLTRGQPGEHAEARRYPHEADEYMD
jgi:hypothetical protein